MKYKACLLIIVGSIAIACNSTIKDVLLPRSVPEEEGMSSQQIIKFIDEVEKVGDEWHSLMILRHGKVVAEAYWYPHCPQFRQTLHSISKTFTSTAIAFAVDEGLLTVNDKLSDIFPEYSLDKKTQSDCFYPNSLSLSIKDMLTMSSGQDPEPLSLLDSAEWLTNFLSYPVKHEPQTKFLYNSVSSFMLSAVLQKVTGMNTLDYLQKKLFNPLGIKDVDWEVSPEGINCGGFGIRVHTEDMAKLGQFYLQKGKWEGKQLLSEKWIDEATTAWSSAEMQIQARMVANLPAEEIAKNAEWIKGDWAQGYGYQIWRCTHNAFRADGAFGQFIIVIPELDAVVAIQAALYDMQRELNLVWDYLLPAFVSENSLPKNQNAEKSLKEKLTNLKIKEPKSITNYELTITDKRIEINNDTCFLNIDGYNFIFGKEKWLAQTTTKPYPHILVHNSLIYRNFPPFNVFGTYAWKNADTLNCYLKYVENENIDKFVCTFADNSLKIEKQIITGNLQKE
ncbi:MAG: beta-lactamase family protein [Paludibacter sp.]|jgi:CubicO group peptidase (beta-lactamase class C family)|nr:beta-lactamase family protein [Paludibacter sp.]